jgi:hypothetical protein
MRSSRSPNDHVICPDSLGGQGIKKEKIVIALLFNDLDQGDVE